MTAQSFDPSQEHSPAGTGAGQPGQAHAWYVGRDGQQFGPVADPEFQAAWHSGQLQPTDLVWREGFAEWVPLSTLPSPVLSGPAPVPVPVANAPPPEPTPTAAPITQPVASAYRSVAVARDVPARPAPQRPADQAISTPAAPLRREPHRAPAAAGPVIADRAAKVVDATTSARFQAPKQKRGRTNQSSPASRFGTAAKAITFAVVMLAIAGLGVSRSPDLTRFFAGLLPGIGASSGADTTAPIGGFAKTAEATDLAMQKSQLWQVLKKYHPEWYAALVREATESAVSGKSDSEIATQALQAVVKLRRANAGNATAAPLQRLKAIALLFTRNLEHLRTQSIDACFQYASAGEGAPAIVALLQSPTQTSALQAQLVATFEAIEAGRRSPSIYPDPRQQDFDVLVNELQTHGWKDADLQLFSDSKALAVASPEKVCRLVTEWFQSQLAIKDADVQMRLIVDSLRPVVAG